MKSIQMNVYRTSVISQKTQVATLSAAAVVALHVKWVSTGGTVCQHQGQTVVVSICVPSASSTDMGCI